MRQRKTRTAGFHHGVTSLHIFVPLLLTFVLFLLSLSATSLSPLRPALVVFPTIHVSLGPLLHDVVIVSGVLRPLALREVFHARAE